MIKNCQTATFISHILYCIYIYIYIKILFKKTAGYNGNIMQINLMGSIDWPSSSPMSTSLSLSILTSIADSKCLNITGGTSSETKTSNSHRSVRGSGAGIHPLGLHPMGLTRGDDFLGQLDGLITPLIRYPLKDILQNYHTLASNLIPLKMGNLKILV